MENVQVRIGGHEVAVVPPKFAVGIVAECFSDEVEYWSASTIYDFLRKMFNLSKEVSERRNITKLDRRRFERINSLHAKGDKKGLIEIFYEEILKAHQEGLLPGFGCGIVVASKGGKKKAISRIYLNPEKRSIRPPVVQVRLGGKYIPGSEHLPLKRVQPIKRVRPPIKRIRLVKGEVYG